MLRRHGAATAWAVTNDRRLRGAAPGADTQQYFDLESEVLEQVRQLVDMQAGCAQKDNAYMVVLGL
eukprot:2363251-Pyramimonas_sp.AAC.1